MALYRTKPIVITRKVDAVKLHVAMSINGIDANPGDYLVTDQATGEQSIEPASTFEQTYTLVVRNKPSGGKRRKKGEVAPAAEVQSA